MPDKEEKNQDRGFTITDKRFASRKKATSESAGPISSNRQAAESTKRGQSRKPAEQQLPQQVDFSSLILSLSHSAMVQMGEIPDPFSNKREKNLPLAKQSIDLIAVLQEKTKGNLTKAEEALLTNVLYDLRMCFVKNSS